MLKLISIVCVASAMALAALDTQDKAPALAIFTKLGLTPQEIAAIDEGKPAAKVLAWGGPSEVYVFGAVHVNGSPSAYLKMARHITRLSGTKGYLGIGELPTNTTAADVSAVTLEPEDVKALKNCREGDCDIQLPTASIRAFQDSVNWTRVDAAGQVNALARGMIVDLLREYRRGGNEALGVYRDKQHPARVSAQFEALVGQAAALPDVMPELRRYLLDYPGAELQNADSYFYWEKVNFGMKPTIRVNHGVIYHTRVQNRDVDAVAIKQLYASHYFHTALDVSMCVADTTKPGARGFYLLTLKGSEQEGLTGPKGSMLRKVVVGKTRSSLEDALASIKRTVEQTASADR